MSRRSKTKLKPPPAPKNRSWIVIVLLVVGLGAYGSPQAGCNSNAPADAGGPIACRAPLAALSQGPGGCKALPAPGAGLLLQQPTAGSARLPDCRPNARGPLATALLLLLRPARAREPARMLCVGSRRRLTHLHQGGSPCRPDDPAGQISRGDSRIHFTGRVARGCDSDSNPLVENFSGCDAPRIRSSSICWKHDRRRETFFATEGRRRNQ